MERRTSPEIAATRVADAISHAGADAVTVSKATDIPLATLLERLAGVSEFTVSDLGRVGGFLRIRPSELIGAM